MLTRSDIKNTISLVGAECVSRGLAFILTIFIARELGVFDFGLYSTAVSFVFLFSVFIEIGLSTYVYREISKKNDAATKYITNALAVQVFLSIIVGVVVFLAAIALNYPPETINVIFILWLWVINISLGRMVRIVFKAYQRMELDALMNFFENSVRFILVLVALFLGFGVIGIAISSVISAILMLVASVFLVTNGHFLHFSYLQYDTAFIAKMLKAALPFALSMIAAVVMYRLSIVILSVIKGNYAVGIFDASFKLTMSLFFIPGLICNAFFPKLSQFAVTDTIQYGKTVVFLTRYIFLMIYPLLMVIYIFAPQIIGLIYTEDFLPTIPILRILVWVNVFNAGAYVAIYALNAANYERGVMRVLLMGVSIKTVVTIPLIIFAGFIGAAIGALISEIILVTMLFCYFQNKKRVQQFLKVLMKIIIVTITSYSAIFLSQWLHFNSLITLSWFVGSFITAVVLLSLVTSKDLSNLKHLLISKAT